MHDSTRTYQELIEEISILKQRNQELEKAEVERKQAEQALRQRNAYLSAIIENQPGLVWLKDKESRFLSVNQAFAISCGYQKSEELLGKTDLDIWPTELAEKYRRDDFLIMETGKPTVVEEPICDKGGICWFETFKTPVLDAQGTIIGTTGYARDITQRRQAERSLRESEEKYRGIFDQSITAVYIFDDKKHFINTNQAGLDLLGYSREELLYMSIPDVDADPVAVLPAHQELLSGGRLINYEHRLRRKDGTILTVLNNSMSITDVHGSVVGMLSTLIDITSRRQAEEALRASQQIIEGIINAIPVRVFWKDKNLVFLGCNQAFAHDAGFTDPQDIIGKDDFQMVWRDQAELYRGDDRQVIETGCSKLFIEEPQETPEGKIITLLTSKIPLRSSKGEISGVLGTYMDITELKQAEEKKRSMEERLQRAEKMESLGLLAGGIAHDLNNVLGILIGYSELLLNKIEESSPVRPYATTIMDASERAAATIQDMLTLARRGVQSRKAVNLNTIILDFLKMPEFQKLSTYHPNLKVKTNMEKEPLHILGSPLQLGKTILNLVSNAAEATPQGGLVTITTSNQYLDRPVQGYDEIREGDYVVLSVSDLGEGIPVNNIKQIFEPFYTKKVMGRSGTGLGLAVVWGTVKDHNGYIDVQSEEGKGSTFTLYFPITREELSAESIPIAVSEYIGHGESILVVDDVEGQRELAAEMLRELNYNVTVASSGEDAVAYLKEQTVDLLVLDMIMDPGMDGLDSYRSILEIHPKQKAIIVSGFSETDRVHVAQTIGAGAYVKKPYIKDKLGVAVRKELERK